MKLCNHHTPFVYGCKPFTTVWFAVTLCWLVPVSEPAQPVCIELFNLGAVSASLQV